LCASKRRTRRCFRFRFTVGVVLGIAGLPQAVQAVVAPLERGLHIGRFEGHASFSLQNRYESNVFHLPATTLADFSTIFEPGVNALWKREDTRFSFGAVYRKEEYWGVQTAATERQSTERWGTDLAAEHTFLTNTSLSAEGRFERTRDPIFADVTLSRDQRERDRWTAGTVIEQSLATGLLDLALEYQFTRDDFRRIEPLTPQGAPPDLDRTGHNLELQAKLRLFTTLTVYGRIDYARLERDQSLRLTPEGTALSNQSDTVLLGFGLTGKRRPQFEWDLFGAVGVGVFSGLESSTTARGQAKLQVRYVPTELTEIALLGQYEDLDGTFSNRLQVLRGQIDLEHKVLPSLTLAGALQVWRTEFEGPFRRRDRSVESRTGVRYQAPNQEWLEIGLSHRWNRRFSSREALFAFTNHTVAVQLNLRY